MTNVRALNNRRLNLADGFVGRDSDGGGKVEAANFSSHGDANSLRRVLLQDFGRQARRLTAENQNVPFLEGDGGVGVLGGLGEKPGAVSGERRGKAGGESFPILDG